MARKETQAQEVIQLVVFNLHGEDFGVNIQNIKEVLKLTQITQLPHTEEYIEGVINLRGEVIPVINLRKRFSILDMEEDKSNNRIIIVEIEGELVGLIVDSVSEVVRLPASDIESPSGKFAGARAEFLEGVGKYEDRLLIILNLGKIVHGEERITLAELTEGR